MGIASARLLTAVCLVLGTPVALVAQAGSQSPVFRSSTQIVRVDAVVVDKDGHPVSGLAKDDFEILDRGAVRPVESLDELAYDRSPTNPVGPLPARLTASDNRDAANDRRVILVIDEPRVLMSRTTQARDVARRIVRALGGRAQIALLRTNGELACEFTKDTRLLLDAIDEVDGEKTLVQYSALGWTGAASMYDNSGLAMREEAARPLPNFKDRGVYTVLADATKTLSYDSGRRTAVVLVSEGHPIVPLPVEEFGSRLTSAWQQTRWEMEWMVASARRANVAVYAIDPRGTARRGEEGYADGWMVGFHDDIASLARNSLREVTDMTGGFAFTGSDDFEAGANRVLDELDHYYVLGFSPGDLEDTTPHQLTVRVKRPGLTVRHRQFFSAAPPKSSKVVKNPTSKDWLRTLVAQVTPTAGLPVSVGATIQPAGRKSHVSITAKADHGAGATGTVDFGLWVIDISKTKISTQSDLPRFFTGSQTVDLTLSPGRYQLRLAARDATSGRGGSAYLTIDVPKR